MPTQQDAVPPREIAADVAAGSRPSPPGQLLVSTANIQHQRRMDLARQFDLGMGARVSKPLTLHQREEGDGANGAKQKKIPA